MTTSLNDSWDLWIHKAKDSNWSESSYIKVSRFNDVESFWAYFNLLNKSVFNDKMLFLMKNGIKPIWEYPAISNGGYWSFKVSNQNILPVFQRVVIFMLIDQISATTGHNIVGVSTSPKKGFHIIKIWNNNAKKGDLKNIDIRNLDIAMSDVIYTPFKKKS